MLSVIIVDVHRPDTDGFALAADLVELVPASRVVLVSSHDISDFGPLVDESPAIGFV